MKVYIAASFAYEDKAKTSQRKDLIEKTVERIKKHLDGDYYLPHQLKIPNAWDISLEEWSLAVYLHDLAALENANVVIFLSFGKENNAGSAWEMGYVSGYNMHMEHHYAKTVVVVKMTNEPESLMISNSVDRIIMSDEIETYDWKTLPEYKTKLEKLS